MHKDPMPYCTPSDLHAFGVPRGATPNPGRVLSSAIDSVCSLDGHGFETGDAILFQPAGDGAMPAGLSAGVTYYAEADTEHTFRVRSTAGGVAITFTDAEDPIMVVAPLNRDAAIAWADRLIDDMAAGQAVPFDDASVYPAGVPEIIRMTSAELAAGKLLSVAGAASKSLSETVDAAVKRIERWSKGLPVRGTPTETRAQVATAATVPVCDTRGWRRWGGL
jgi:hypothetical protein